MDIVAIATGVVKLLQPALPYLDPMKTALQKKISDATAGAAFDQAKALWAKITSRFKDDKELQEAANEVATVKEIYQETAKEQLIKILAERLNDSSDLAKELLELLGGKNRLQEIVAGNEATIRNVKQSMAGAGTQRTQAGDKSVIDGATQEQTL